ncbi:MAG: YceI family protein [Acidimicrobiales bacterium]
MARYRWTSESKVEIHATSSVHPIHGETNAVTGEAVVEVSGGAFVLDRPKSGYVEMPVDALKSGNKLEDFELRRRLDAKKYPTIRYDVKDVSGGPESFKLTGALTFHGVTRDFPEEATARIEGGVLYVEGEHTFNIEQWGVKAPKILKLQVYPDVRVVARLVGREG